MPKILKENIKDYNKSKKALEEAVLQDYEKVRTNSMPGIRQRQDVITYKLKQTH